MNIIELIKYKKSNEYKDYINALENNMADAKRFTSYQRSLPCGVLFVLREKEGDFELRANDEMQNVDFFANSEQLAGIVCTDEVKEKVTKWCIDSKMDTNLVFNYDSFLEYAKNNDLEKGKSL